MSKIRTRWNMLKSVENTVTRYGMFNDKNYLISYMILNDNIKHAYYLMLVKNMILLGERIMNTKRKR
jgi:hypothetical protein